MCGRVRHGGESTGWCCRTPVLFKRGAHRHQPGEFRAKTGPKNQKDWRRGSERWPAELPYGGRSAAHRRRGCTPPPPFYAEGTGVSIHVCCVEFGARQPPQWPTKKPTAWQTRSSRLPVGGFSQAATGRARHSHAPKPHPSDGRSHNTSVHLDVRSNGRWKQPERARNRPAGQRSGRRGGTTAHGAFHSRLGAEFSRKHAKPTAGSSVQSVGRSNTHLEAATAAGTAMLEEVGSRGGLDQFGQAGNTFQYVEDNLMRNSVKGKNPIQVVLSVAL